MVRLQAKQPRAKRASDEAYNARRRFRRAAQRYEKKAAKSSGAEKARYEFLAQEKTKKALETYAEGKEPKGEMGRLAEKYAGGYKREKQSIGQLIAESLKESIKDKIHSREEMANTILQSGNVGSRLFAGLIDIWQDAENYKGREQAILEHFGAKDMLEVIEMLEEAGIDIYTAPDDRTIYDEKTLQVQEFVISHATKK